jgi:transcriptional regulator with GAF, ATPase, and Fis domain
MIETFKPNLVLLDIFLKGDRTGIELAEYLAEKDIAFVYLSANSNEAVLQAARATQPYGFLVKPFRERDVLITLGIAHYRHVHSVEAKLRNEQSLRQELTNIMLEELSWEGRLLKVVRTLQKVVPFDFVVLGLKKAGEDLTGACAFYRLGFDEYQTIHIPDLCNMLGTLPVQFAAMSDRILATGPHICNGVDFTRDCAELPGRRQLAKKFQLCSNLAIPLKTTREGVFFFSFYSRRPEAYSGDHLHLFLGLQTSLGITIDRLLAFDEIKKLSEQLSREKPALKEEAGAHATFRNIVAASHSMLHVLDQVSQVASLSTSVLLLGESGTGKELVAKSIHELSPRKGKPMVKINCAALPANLIESELFGHEKGAFTGATDKRIGKFEMANGGTIFLDEVGEMPVDMQSKLLRVLQEREIERVGGQQNIRIDVRIIAATNRNLEFEIANGKFRLDLYYRLCVFPVTLPPLRERKEDIPLLANHFAHELSRATGKAFHGIEPSAMEELLQYHWPGNIREMANIVEQAFVLNDGKTPLQWRHPLINSGVIALSDLAIKQPASLEHVKEMQQATEREYILSVLKKSNGRIRGAGGAAETLGLKPTTLESRMEKLGIKKNHRFDGD